jgi:polar amino acid transport system substrate-binding protein
MTFCILLILLIIFPIKSDAESVIRLATLYTTEDSERFLTTAYKYLNIKVEFIELPSVRSLWVANNGMVDGIESKIAGIDKIYPNLLMIKVPTKFSSLFVCTKKANVEVNGWESLRAYRIAYLRGIKIIEEKLQGFQIEGVTTIQQAFMMLDHDRVDVLIADIYQTIEILPNYPSIKMLSPAIDSFPVYHYVHKKHADLVPKLEIIFEELLASN